MDLYWDLRKEKEKEKIGSYVKLAKLTGVNRDALTIVTGKQIGRAHV